MASPANSGTDSPPAHARRRLPWWKTILFTVILIFIAFAVPEGILRLLDYPPERLATTGAGDEGSDVDDLFWGVTASLKEEPFDHKELGTKFYVTTNSRSMRNTDDFPLGHQPKTVRVLALGDSTTFGWGVEQALTYPAQVEALLREKHPDITIDVLNGGVPGYTSFQGLYHYKKFASAYKPDIVLFGYIVQDARKVKISDKQQALKAYETREMRRYLAHPLYRFHLYRLLRDRYNWLRSLIFQKQSEVATDVNGLVPRVPLPDYRENIQTFKQLTDGDKARLVLFGFPLEVVGYTREHRDLLEELAASMKLDHFDPSAVVAAEARKRTLYFPQDRGHPNADGCKLIAEQVAGYIEQQGLIAAALKARE